MKLTGVENVLQTLETMTHRVAVQDPIRTRARAALDAMLTVS
jgi:quinolinate synthase